MASIYLTFTAPNPVPALGYLVKWRIASPQGAWSNMVFPQSEGPIQIGGVTSTVYDIEVYARCGSGENVTLSLVSTDVTTVQSCTSYTINNPTGSTKLLNYEACGTSGEEVNLNILAGTTIGLCIVTGQYTAASGLVVTAGGECVPPL
jgi:hypothetical protein